MSRRLSLQHPSAERLDCRAVRSTILRSACDARLQRPSRVRDGPRDSLAANSHERDFQPPTPCRSTLSCVVPLLI